MSDGVTGTAAAALRTQADQLMLSGAPESALACLDRALELLPRDPLTLNDRGNALQELQRHAEAVDCYDRALREAPAFVVAECNRGNALRALRRLTEALASFDSALRAQPLIPELWNNRGSVLRDQGRFEEALANFDRAVALRAGFGTAHENRGKVLLDMARPREALAAFEAALLCNSNDAEALFGRAAALLRLESRLDDAVADFDRAAQLGIAPTEVLVGKAAALAVQKRYRDAAQCLAELLALAPASEYARGSLLHARLQEADWQNLAPEVAALRGQVSAGRRATHPLSLLPLIDSPELQLQCARVYGAHLYAPAAALGPCAPARVRRGHERIRVAYVSADFRDHPVAYQLAGVIERHDRRRFEITAIALRSGSGQPYEQRIRLACDRFIDVSECPDRDVAGRMRALEIDIAVDLMGYTRGMRLGIFAHRAAPVQVSYLGYAGTLGVAYMDYLLADAIVVPAQEEAWYQERIVRLPHCFMPTDDQRAIAVAPTRAAAGLPEDAFVYAAFCSAHKVNPALFDVWMQLLREEPHSVLWMTGMPPGARENLGREAERRGVSGDRLLHGEHAAGNARHLARIALADLCLDTWPYGGHSTACDVLWAGVPLLTLAGRGLHSRVAASALAAVGVPELITSSLEHYGARARALAASPRELRALRARLATPGRPLFDTRRYCLELEAAYREMQARAERGAIPDGFSVADQSHGIRP